MSSSTRDSLLRGVLENPFDDAPRKVYADWLIANEPGPYADYLANCLRRKDLMNLSRSSQSINRPALMGELGYVEALIHQSPWKNTHYRWHDKEIGARVTLYSQNGMVYKLESAVSDWTDIVGCALFSRHPIEKVILTDKKCEYNRHVDYQHLWTRWERTDPLQAGHAVPAWVFDLLPNYFSETFYPFDEEQQSVEGLGITYSLVPVEGAQTCRCYRTKNLAMDALSKAMVDYYRSIIGLPTLYQTSK